jgi:LAO/AO transport system kinase
LHEQSDSHLNQIENIRMGDFRSLARAISLAENGNLDFLKGHTETPLSDAKIIGITGPPGAGKSTLTDALIELLRKEDKKVAVLCVDPSSPFGGGALLGDRVRMSRWYTDEGVFIRSFSSRGSLGGLHPRMIEIIELIRIAPFDYIIVETVGVGQSEVEIASLADTTLVVLVPEAGDEIQVMKAGLMEIANILVLNKADRPEADFFLSHLHQLTRKTRILQTVATEKKGIKELLEAIWLDLQANREGQPKKFAEKAIQLIVQEKMRKINRKEIEERILEAMKEPGFNLLQFVRIYIEAHPPI